MFPFKYTIHYSEYKLTNFTTCITTFYVGRLLGDTHKKTYEQFPIHIIIFLPGRNSPLRARVYQPPAAHMSAERSERSFSQYRDDVVSTWSYQQLFLFQTEIIIKIGRYPKFPLFYAGTVIIHSLAKIYAPLGLKPTLHPVVRPQSSMS